MVAVFDPLQGRPAGECALRDDFGRQTPAPARIAYV
jgi:hypothetical protein